MLISKLAVAVLGGVLLMGGSLSTLADADRAQDTRARLMQHDDRGRYAPSPRDWQDPRMQRDYRYRGRGAHEQRGSYWRWDNRPSWDRSYPREYRDWGVRIYPPAPSFDHPRGYPPPRRVGPDRNDFPSRHNPHPPGIYRPLHDNGLRLPPPR